MTYTMQPTPSKRWYQRWWVWVIVGFVVLVVLPVGACTAIVGGLYAIGSSQPDRPDPVASSSPEPSPSVVQPGAAPTPTASPSSESSESSESSASAEPLAEAVWAEVLAGYGGTVPSSSPLFAVVGVEDVSGGTIRVFVQQDLDEAGREEVARQVFNLGAFNNTALTTVVVQASDGRDSNHYRSDFPYLPQ